MSAFEAEPGDALELPDVLGLRCNFPSSLPAFMEELGDGAELSAVLKLCCEACPFSSAFVAELGDASALPGACFCPLLSAFGAELGNASVLPAALEAQCDSRPSFAESGVDGEIGFLPRITILVWYEWIFLSFNSPLSFAISTFTSSAFHPRALVSNAILTPSKPSKCASSWYLPTSFNRLSFGHGFVGLFSITCLMSTKPAFSNMAMYSVCMGTRRLYSSAALMISRVQ